MKRYLLQSVIAVIVLTLVAGVAATQLERVQPQSHIRIAGDGTGPIPTCRPGTNCNPDDQLKQIAGDGTGPIPTCRPGTNCNPDDQMRQIAGQLGETRVKLEGLIGNSETILAELS